ncbi:sugar phosphate isomerase/epimerase family protein [Streptomyces sp. NPDC058195]|uniref:sugar phosphate isomerase/epimerase family protein n=1 Tax=Streptomyces sp. NPDC058195 TaxID=3346375 RepID=UPI0036E25631
MNAPRMRVGVCGRKFPGAERLGPEGVLAATGRLGHAGVFFRQITDMSPDLDPGRLADLRARADADGLYLEAGLGKVNPYNISEETAVRDLGDGDHLLGMTRMIEAAAAVGITDLWADTANYQRHSWGLRAVDRFRTDVTWNEQLAAIERYLRRLAPVLRAHGCRVNLETHEEITTHEVVALVEAVGPDAVGVTLDLANVVVRGEDPVAAARRVAPYTHQTHMRDVVLAFTDAGMERQIRACGDGVIDFAAVLDALAAHRADGPPLNLTIENTMARDWNGIPLHDPRWQAAHPDLPMSDLLELVRLCDLSEERMRAGKTPGLDAYYPEPPTEDWALDFIRRSADHLTALQTAPQPTKATATPAQKEPS